MNATMTVSNMTKIGHGHDGDLFAWTETDIEGARHFEEYASTVTGASGTTYGITLVREVV